MGRYDGDRDVIYVEREEGGGAFKWLVIGAALGAGLALLFAPSTGKELRKEIRRGVRKAKNLAEEAVDEFRDSLGAGDDPHHAMDSGGVYADDDDLEDDVADDVEADDAEDQDGDGAVKAGRPSVRAARQELEQRLAAARARRRRALAGEEEPVA